MVVGGPRGLVARVPDALEIGGQVARAAGAEQEVAAVLEEGLLEVGIGLALGVAGQAPVGGQGGDLARRRAPVDGNARHRGAVVGDVLRAQVGERARGRSRQVRLDAGSRVGAPEAPGGVHDVARAGREQHDDLGRARETQGGALGPHQAAAGKDHADARGELQAVGEGAPGPEAVARGARGLVAIGEPELDLARQRALPDVARHHHLGGLAREGLAGGLARDGRRMDALDQVEAARIAGGHGRGERTQVDPEELDLGDLEMRRVAGLERQAIQAMGGLVRAHREDAALEALREGRQAGLPVEHGPAGAVGRALEDPVGRIPVGHVVGRRQRIAGDRGGLRQLDLPDHRVARALHAPLRAGVAVVGMGEIAARGLPGDTAGLGPGIDREGAGDDGGRGAEGDRHLAEVAIRAEGAGLVRAVLVAARRVGIARP